jgi:hypothetical protein
VGHKTVVGRALFASLVRKSDAARSASPTAADESVRSYFEDM